jgi:putative FmdB family regulatory protein
MPIYDYVCGACGARFEEWVRKEQDTPACPECSDASPVRQLSKPSVHSSGVKERGLASAKARDARLGAEKARAQREYELSHDD